MTTFLLPWAQRGLLISLILQGGCGSSSEPVSPDSDGSPDGSGGDGTPADGQADGTPGDGTPADGADGSGDGTGGEGWVRHDVAASELCTELTTLLCRAEQACCTNEARRHASEAACLQAEIASCVSDVEPAALSAKTGYSPSAAGEKLEDLYGKLESCDLTLGDWFVARDGLLGVFQGTVASGGDCTPSSRTDRASVLSCQTGSVCQLNPLPLSGTCGQERTSGQTCVTEIECSDGLRCDPPETLGGTCQARLADGSACSVNGDCSSLLCNAQRCEARTADSVYCFN